MEYIIRKATDEDIYRIGYVHYKAWQETYRNIIDDEYLDSLTLESRINKVHLYLKNCIVCELDKKVIAFATCYPARDEDLINALEISAIYVLREHKGLKIGTRLVNQCINENSEYHSLCLWVAKDNVDAITAYSRMGFDKDGKESIYKIGKTDLSVIRMVRKIDEK